MRRKHVVSISLGSSKGNKTHELDVLGQPFLVERRGVDGDLKKFGDLFAELDGKVDALGVGGADIFLVIRDRKYVFRQILNLASRAKTTPFVDGSGLKHTLERKALYRLQDEGILDFKTERALLVSAVDRYGMGQALDELCPRVIYGDLLFGLGLPIPIRRYDNVVRLGKLLLPIITKLPFKWFYPTGEKQTKRTPKFPKIWSESTVLCGDTHLIRRFMPDDLRGATVITQTIRKANIEEFAAANASKIITTTPIMGGETFATNVMEGIIVALLEKRPEHLTEGDYLGVLHDLDWKPEVIDLH